MPVLPNATGGATWIAQGNGTAVDWPGGEGTFTCDGTWNGATMTLQRSADAGTTWVAMGDDTTLTANGHGGFIFGACQLRVVATVADPTSLTARVINLPRM